MERRGTISSGSSKIQFLMKSFTSNKPFLVGLRKKRRKNYAWMAAPGFRSVSDIQQKNFPPPFLPFSYWKHLQSSALCVQIKKCTWRVYPEIAIPLHAVLQVVHNSKLRKVAKKLHPVLSRTASNVNSCLLSCALVGIHFFRHFLLTKTDDYKRGAKPITIIRFLDFFFVHSVPSLTITPIRPSASDTTGEPLVNHGAGKKNRCHCLFATICEHKNGTFIDLSELVLCLIRMTKLGRATEFELVQVKRKLHGDHVRKWSSFLRSRWFATLHWVSRVSDSAKAVDWCFVFVGLGVHNHL